MLRLTGFICAVIFLSACETATTAQETPAVNDKRVAKEVFGHIPLPFYGAGEQAVGTYAKGCQSGAERLEETGSTWQAMRLNRNRYWGQPQLIDYVKDLSAFAATLPGWNGLYIGDISQPRGGPMLTGHASHQVGLDVDIWMLPPERLDLSAQERETLSSISMRRQNGAFTNDRWSPQHEALLKQAASDSRVARIFVFPGAKVEMCKTATPEDTQWLRKIRPWWGHHYHFHVRLNCPEGDTECREQAPPPAGNGCAEAQGWVDRILNPPPPSGVPAKPRGPVLMQDLPGLCQAVANGR